MTAIWQNVDSGWRLLSPSGFPAEAALHDLVEQAPHVLPLAGAPRLIVLGREVLLGGNYADLIAVEPTGRLTIVEIKLAKNAEARRAVVAQILTYAAYLRGVDLVTLERDVLGSHLRKRGYQGVAHAAAANDQEGAYDAAAFTDELTASLREGGFRLVLVLDEAPPELARLVGYLRAVAGKVLIDLVTVTAYNIAGSEVIVPRRVDVEREPEPGGKSTPAPKAVSGYLAEGGEDFVATIEQAPEDQRPALRRLADWATGLEDEGLAQLWTYHGKAERWTLLPRVRGGDAGLVTVWNDKGASLQFWRSVFVHRAPNSLPRVEELAQPTAIGQGTHTRTISDDLLEALTEAYREAAAGHVQLGEG